jgi:hypothetical protein
MSDRLRQANHLVNLLAGRWTLTVLAQLSDRGRRYQDLHESLDGIAHKVLTETLRRAVRDGLIGRLAGLARALLALAGVLAWRTVALDGSRTSQVVEVGRLGREALAVCGRAKPVVQFR